MPITWASAQGRELISRPGDQLRPSMAGDLIAFVEYPLTNGVISASPELWYANVADRANPIFTSIDRSGDVLGGPGIAGTRVAYRTLDYVQLFDTLGGGAQKPIFAPGTGKVVISATLVAWEQAEDQGNGVDVGWSTGLRSAPAVVLGRSGNQRSVAVAERWVAFIDQDGAVHLIDTAAYTPPVGDGLAGGEEIVDLGPTFGVGALSEVALHAASPGLKPTVAVIHAVTGGAEIGVVAPSVTGWTPLGSVDTPTGKSNLHLFGEWVAFDEVTPFGDAVVRLVNWAVQRTFSPAWRGNTQTLNYVYVAGSGDEVRLVWTEAGQTAGYGLDVWELSVPLPLTDEGTGGTVTCGSPDAVVIGELDLLAAGKPSQGHDGDDDGDRDADDDVDDDRDDRDVKHDAHGHDLDDHGNDGWHLKDTLAHDESWHGERVWRAFAHAELDYTGFDPAAPRRVVVCIDSSDVASAWVGVGAEIVAGPSDFSAGTLSLEARLTIPPGDHDVGAVVIAKKGGTLRVRVLDDPGGDVDGPAEGSTCNARGDCPSGHRFGCGSSGGAGTVLSILLVGLLVARPARRRSRP
jgi:hypothetical protein